jgi:hypothetical protein
MRARFVTSLLSLPTEVFEIPVACSSETLFRIAQFADGFGAAALFFGV